MTPPRPWRQSSALTAALQYAKRGWEIFPAPPGEKKSYKAADKTNGHRWGATKDPGEIKQDFKTWSKAGVGILTGEVNGIFVIEADTKDGHEHDGIASIGLLELEYGPLPDTLMSESPSGSCHRFFNTPNDGRLVRNSASKLAPGVDVRGEGGMVIAPPSARPGKGVYRWVNYGTPIADAPEWLLDKVCQQPAHSNGNGHHPPLTPDLAERAAHYGAAALAGMVEEVEALQKGNRNTGLNTIAFRAGRLVASGCLEAAAVEASLTEAALKIKLPHREIKATVPRSIREGISKGSILELDFNDQVEYDFATLANLSVASDVDVEVASEEATFPSRLLEVPGLVGEIAQWITDASVYPQPQFSLAAALLLVGTAAGRYFGGPTKSATHLFFVCIAPSGHGKDWPLQAIGSILMASGLQVLLGPSQFISMPALINFLKRQPLSVCCMDEFGAFLRRINNKRASGFEVQISSILRTAWSSSFKVMTTPEWAGVPSEHIYAPAPSVFALSTQNEFYDSLAGADIVNGMLNRCIVLESPLRPTPRTPLVDSLQVPDFIVEQIKDIYNASGGAMSKLALSNPLSSKNPNFKMLDISPNAEAIRVAFLNETHMLADQQDDDKGAFWVRTAEIAIRLATIVTVGLRVDCIEEDTMQWACDYARCVTDKLMMTALVNISDSETQEIFNIIKSTIKKHRGKDGWIKRADLWRKIKGRFDTKKMTTALAHMVQNSEEILIRSVPANRAGGGGQPSVWYSLKKDEQPAQAGCQEGD